MAAEHCIVQVLGAALPAPNAQGFVLISQRLLHYLVDEQLLFADDVLDSHPSWALKHSRATQLFAALDAAGCDWEPITDSNLRLSAQTFARRMAGAVAALPAADRTITLADCLVAPRANLPSFWPHITARLLMGADAHAGMWVQFRALFPSAFADSELTSASFLNLFDTLASICGGPNFAALPLPAQAVQAVKFVRRTRSPTELAFFMPATECLMGILRLADNEAERFLPLFELGWRSYSVLHAAFPNEMDGLSSARLVTTAAVRLGAGTQLTNPVVHAVCDAFRLHVTDMEISEVRGASNDARLTWLLSRTAERRVDPSSNPSHKGGGGSTKLSDEQWDELYKKPAYKTLYGELDALNTAPIDDVLVASKMMSALHPAGLLFLAGDTLRQPLWRKFSGVVDTSLDSAINNALSVDAKGQRQPHWGPVVKTGLGKVMVTGRFALRGDHKLDLWNAFARECVAQREGDHVAAKFAANAPAHGLLLDHNMLRRAMPSVVVAFAAIGYTGTGAGTFASTLNGIFKRCCVLADLPDTVPQKTGLVLDFQEAVLLIFDEASQAHRTMVKTPAPYAERKLASYTSPSAPSVLFISTGSSGSEKIIKFDSQIERILADLKLDPSMRQMPSLRDVDASTASSSSPLQFVMRSRSRQEEQSPGKGKVPRLDEGPHDDGRGDRSRHSDMPPGVTHNHGGMAWRYGVYASDDALLYGTRVVRSEQGGNLSDALAAVSCYADLAPGREENDWRKWCTRRDCRRHQRPEGVTLISSPVAAECDSEDAVIRAFPLELHAAAKPRDARMARDKARHAEARPGGGRRGAGRGAGGRGAGDRGGRARGADRGRGRGGRQAGNERRRN